MRVGGEVQVTAEGFAGEPVDRPHHGDRLRRGRGHAQRAGRGDARQPRAAACGPGCSCRRTCGRASTASILSLPASAISYAPYGDSVFVVSEMKGPGGAPYKGVRQQFVKLGAARGDQVAVVSGIEAGDEVVTSGAFKLRNGAAVLVDNSVQPGNSPAPKPEDN